MGNTDKKKQQKKINARDDGDDDRSELQNSLEFAACYSLTPWP